MADGRDVVSETYEVIRGIVKELDQNKDSYTADDVAALEDYVGTSLVWVKKCRGKVWLRSKEGTDLANVSLAAANLLKESLGDPSAAKDAARDLFFQTETLGKKVASKAAIVT